MPEWPATFRDWMLAEYADEPGTITDLAEHGAACGWPGLTCYSDTVALYERYHEGIWAWLGEEADGLGLPHALALVATFGGAAQVSCEVTLRNLLVWAMAEATARELAAEPSEEVPRCRTSR